MSKTPEIIYFNQDYIEDCMNHNIGLYIRETTLSNKDVSYILKSKYDEDLGTYANVIKQHLKEIETLKDEIEKLKNNT